MPLTRLLKLSLLSGPIGAILSAALMALVVSPLAHDSTPVGATGYLFPDLIVDDLISRNQFGGDCTVPAGVDVVVRNIGKDTAVASLTRLVMDGFSTEDLSTPALTPGQSVTLQSYNLPYTSGSHSFTATADYPPPGMIELDEDNNSRTETLSVTTLPTCTPTPVVTPQAVGGIAELPGIRESTARGAARSDDASGQWWAIAISGALALGCAAWWARRSAVR